METRKLFHDADGYWMEILPTELEEWKDHPEQIRWFGPVPTSKVKKITKAKD